jgi:hypothetical protein
MGLDLFNISNKSRDNRAYKVYIEPYTGGAKDWLQYGDMTRIVLDKLKIIDPGYKAQWGESLLATENTVNYNTATIEADSDDDAASLSFNYTATWSESKLADVIGDFIPSNITMGVGRKLGGGLGGAAKLTAGASAYHGTFPAMNLNDRKLMAVPDFLKYNLKIKVVDKDGTGSVLKALTKLMVYTAPLTINRDVSITDIVNGVKELAKDVSTIGSNALSLTTYNQAAGKAGEALSSTGEAVAKTGVDVLKATLSTLNTGFAVEQTFNDAAKLVFGMTPQIELISSPVPLTIYVSNYFVHQLCVIDSVSVNLSKQINVSGYPVYGTFDLSISAREKTPLDLGVTGDSNLPNVLRNVSIMGKKNSFQESHGWNQPRILMGSDAPPVTMSKVEETPPPIKKVISNPIVPEKYSGKKIDSVITVKKLSDSEYYNLSGAPAETTGGR